MEVPKEKIGAIIGQRGSEIVRLEMESGAKINMPKKEQVEAEGKAMVTVQLLAPCCARVTHALRAYSRQLCDTPGNCADHWTGDGNREGQGNDSGAGGCSQDAPAPWAIPVDMGQDLGISGNPQSKQRFHSDSTVTKIIGKPHRKKPTFYLFTCLF